MIKILHTADWHIGKRLYKQSLDEELELFFDWLIEVITKHQVDILLVSGDIFDMANPSHAARKMYYKVLKSLIKTEVKVVVTGGNHDSITNLDASSDLLNMLDINVVGGAPPQIEELVFHYHINNNDVVIAAIPFLRDRDLRSGHHQNESRIEQLQQGITTYYEDVSSYIKETFPDIPCIAMGHLYLQSAKTSDSERDIQIGNQAGISSTAISDRFDYIALGHIHRPQSFNNGKVRYSGSPISLSFSERKDEKQVILLNIDGNHVESESISVPKFRDLLKVKGSFAEVKELLYNWQPTKDQQLTTLVEVEIIEDTYQEKTIREINMIMNDFTHSDLLILKYRYTFINSPKSLSAVMPSKAITDLKPTEVFDQKLANESFSPELMEALRSNFCELLDEVYSHAEMK